jgi:hypothetical protein
MKLKPLLLKVDKQKNPKTQDLEMNGQGLKTTNNEMKKSTKRAFFDKLLFQVSYLQKKM